MQRGEQNEVMTYDLDSTGPRLIGQPPVSHQSVLDWRGPSASCLMYPRRPSAAPC